MDNVTHINWNEVARLSAFGFAIIMALTTLLAR